MPMLPSCPARWRRASRGPLANDLRSQGLSAGPAACHRYCGKRQYHSTQHDIHQVSVTKLNFFESGRYLSPTATLMGCALELPLF
jgi:hypothetical protein